MGPKVEAKAAIGPERKTLVKEKAVKRRPSLESILRSDSVPDTFYVQGIQGPVGPLGQSGITYNTLTAPTVSNYYNAAQLMTQSANQISG